VVMLRSQTVIRLRNRLPRCLSPLRTKSLMNCMLYVSSGVTPDTCTASMAQVIARDHIARIDHGASTIRRRVLEDVLFGIRAKPQIDLAV